MPNTPNTSPRASAVPEADVPTVFGSILAALLADGGQATARRNAQHAIHADQIRAAQRAEANRILDVLASETTSLRAD